MYIVYFLLLKEYDTQYFTHILSSQLSIPFLLQRNVAAESSPIQLLYKCTCVTVLHGTEGCSLPNLESEHMVPWKLVSFRIRVSGTVSQEILSSRVIWQVRFVSSSPLPGRILLVLWITIRNPPDNNIYSLTHKVLSSTLLLTLPERG